MDDGADGCAISGARPDAQYPWATRGRIGTVELPSPAWRRCSAGTPAARPLYDDAALARFQSVGEIAQSKARGGDCDSTSAGR